ncbi:MAG: SpoIIE family protein phosphatase [Planctomycetota bacterium]|nr:SpoIIE family protein phosphatase [Planctomycetota bacterium]
MPAPPPHHLLTSSAKGHADLKGLSLGIKYAIFTALIVAISILIVVIISYNSASKVVDEEINQAGIRLVKALATIDISYWQSIPDRPAGTPDPLSLLASTLGEKMGLNEHTIINVLITDRDKKPLSAMHRTQVSLVGVKELPPIVADAIEMVEGKYKEPGTDYLVRTRMFQKKVLSPDLRSQGFVILFLSARKIDEVLSNLFVAFILPALISILGGGLIGFIMARLVTQPVKVLMEDMTIVSDGNLEHRSRVNSTDEVGVLAASFDKMTESLVIAHQRELETKALEHELNIAREIQSNLLPKEIPVISGYTIAGRYFPCFEVSGDYYDILPVDDEHIGIVVADVSGKGVPASMIMTMARSLIRMESERNLSTADTLKKVNRILARDLRRGMFVTAMYFILNIKTGEVQVSSAGHNPLVVWRKAKGNYELVNPNGIALGFDRGPIFDRTIKEDIIQINPGDFVVSFTDGITETMNEENEEFGGERFYKLLSSVHKLEPEQIIETTIKSLEEYKGSAPQHDDITLVCVKRT